MKKSRSKGGAGLRILYGTLLLLIVGFVVVIRYAYQAPDEGKQISLAGVFQLADQGRIVSAKLLDEDAQVTGLACASSPSGARIPGGSGDPGSSLSGAPSGATPGPGACSGKTSRFHASYPRSDVGTQQLIEKIFNGGAQVEIDKQSNKAVAKLLVTFVFPLVMLANLFGLIFMSRGGESSIADIAGFGTIRRKAQRKGLASTGITFSDVAGVPEAVVEMREVTDYLTDPSKFEALGASVPKGVLLFGPPGCGKTLLAKAVAGETGVPFLSMSGAEFVESLVGVGAARVRDLFRQVREVAPAIVFIDEIDAVGRKREGEGVTGGEREQTINQLLIEIDGFESAAGIVVMGATNRPDILDPALLRPGRFDRHVTLAPPDVNGRREILELHSDGKPMSTDVDLDLVARRTPGFTGADLANVVNEAALLTIREDSGSEITMRHFVEAVQRVLHGPQRRGQIMSPQERKRIAFHEAGHAVVAAGLGRAADVQRVSVVARGRGLGQAMVSSENEKVLLTKPQMQGELTIAMAGIACEKLVFGNSSSTAEQDIDKANELARQMVGHYAMSDKVGPLRVLRPSSDGYLGSESAVMDAVSGQTMQEFDHEVKRLIQLAEKRAAFVLEQNRSHLDQLVARLQEEETLEAISLDTVLSQVQEHPELLDDDPDAGAIENGRSRVGRTSKTSKL
ncbi:MAG: ATP-dependent zinc metalloprotease FtsH [Actinomycetota bacterium]